MQSRSTQSKSHAPAFEILAKALPDMIQARSKSRRIQPRVQGQMGHITRKVAQHLGVEICTIFLFANDDQGDRLVLAEAFGYQDDAIGKIKSRQEGITAMIAGLTKPGTCTDVVCNFTVQDHPQWAGQFDTELPRHGWTLLGTPIVGADGKIKGVIKFENKKSNAHSEKLSTLLSTLGSRVNTPGQILLEVRRLLSCIEEALRANPQTAPELSQDISGRSQAIASIAEQLVDGCASLSGDIPNSASPADASAILTRLEDPDQHTRMDELELQTAALIAALEPLQEVLKQQPTLWNQSIAEPMASLRKILNAFALALRAYTPFSRSDVYLVRAVAALIAAAMDISASQTEASLHALQHGLKSGTDRFLLQVLSLTQAAPLLWNENTNARAALRSLWLTALNISGPQDAIGETGDKSVLGTTTLRDFSEKLLKSRLLYYCDCAKVWGKTLSEPQSVLEGWLGNEQVATKCFPEDLEFLLLGVCDIIFCNAVEYGGSKIEIALSFSGSQAFITFTDDGGGIDAATVAALEGQEFGLSRRSRFGLKAAKHVMSKHGAELQISCPVHSHRPDGQQNTCVRIIFSTS